MAELRIPIILNKGQRGVPLSKLARISYELQQFLGLLGEDLHIDPGAGWIGTDFTNGSLNFVAEKVNPVEEPKVKAFKQAFRNVAQRRPDARVRPSTIRQFAKIGEPMDLGEVAEFSLPSIDNDERDEWCELTKQTALAIAFEVQDIVRSHGGVQGIIHSVFLGASPAHFQLRELSTGELVKCVYSSRKQYDELAAVLKEQNAVVHVYGVIRTDFVNRQIQELRVEKIELAESFSKEDFERFVGCAPNLLGGQDLQEFIDAVRERAS
ncbi:hypothetical protein SBA5_910010 [Candidatus Sulfotelmatomonas gaucii]|uniref:Uncharacterized protein n=1 Tax=Candidatus Sulfuritelmatomonas gaucii TaxID=2043161 RepID=A0A2N9M8T0_9BACT|nr:hypothetical protein SBA5_910010 [Candidatus Sulfotelmatomonas gaucii]